MEIDDSPFKQILGELMVYSARSRALFHEIQNFLKNKESTDLGLFRINDASQPGEPRFRLEPSETLLDFTVSIRQRITEPDKEPALSKT